MALHLPQLSRLSGGADESRTRIAVSLANDNRPLLCYLSSMTKTSNAEVREAEAEATKAKWEAIKQIAQTVASIIALSVAGYSACTGAKRNDVQSTYETTRTAIADLDRKSRANQEDTERLKATIKDQNAVVLEVASAVNSVASSVPPESEPPPSSPPRTASRTSKKAPPLPDISSRIPQPPAPRPEPPETRLPPAAF